MSKSFFVLFLILILNFKLGFCEEVKTVNRKVAITMDGLAIKRQKEILKIYEKFQVPGTFAINEDINLKRNSEKEISKAITKYLKAGFIVMNHTANHQDANVETFDEFKADVINGANILDKVVAKAQSNQKKYFRFPFLSRGATYDDRVKINDFLTEQGYTIAPISMDTIDWKFQVDYSDATKNKDKKRKAEIEAIYLKFIKDMIERQELWSDYLFGRNPNHILLVHPASITLDNLAKILQIFKDAGYEFISLEEALSDDIYKIDTITECRNDVGCSGGSQFNILSIIDGKLDWYKEHKAMFRFPELPKSNIN